LQRPILTPVSTGNGLAGDKEIGDAGHIVQEKRGQMSEFVETTDAMLGKTCSGQTIAVKGRSSVEITDRTIP
jgi:hypothetical protein